MGTGLEAEKITKRSSADDRRMATKSNGGVAVITGASGGIGAALARALGREGYRVALLARRREELDRQASELKAEGIEAIPLEADVTRASALLEAVRTVEQRWGGIDLAIANAGISLPSRAKSFDLSAALKVVDTNLGGTLALFAAVIPRMLERRSGTFVGIASVAGLRGIPGIPVYSATKAGMQAFLEAARVELRHSGVRVITVNPGFVDTAMTAGAEYRMPLLVSAERAANHIVRKIGAGRAVIEFPLPMSLALRFARLLPASIYDRLFWIYAKRSGR